MRVLVGHFAGGRLGVRSITSMGRFVGELTGLLCLDGAQVRFQREGILHSRDTFHCWATFRRSAHAVGNAHVLVTFRTRPG